MCLFLSALMTTLKSVAAKGVRATWNTSVPKFAIFFSTYRLAPCTIVMTVISVATPIVSPTTVRTVRSLCACKEDTLCATLSLFNSIRSRDRYVFVFLPNPDQVLSRVQLVRRPAYRNIAAIGDAVHRYAVRFDDLVRLSHGIHKLPLYQQT